MAYLEVNELSGRADCGVVLYRTSDNGTYSPAAKGFVVPPSAVPADFVMPMTRSAALAWQLFWVDNNVPQQAAGDHYVVNMVSTKDGSYIAGPFPEGMSGFMALPSVSDAFFRPFLT